MAQAPQRLKQRRDFLHVARAGRKWAAPGLVLQVLDRNSKTHPSGRSDTVGCHGERPKNTAGGGHEERDIRVGFTVTRKVGGAVVRNRARRRLRAAVETVMPTHATPGKDYVVIGRAATNAREFSDLLGDLETAMRKLNAWRDAETTAGKLGYDEDKRSG